MAGRAPGRGAGRTPSPTTAAAAAAADTIEWVPVTEFWSGCSTNPARPLRVAKIGDMAVFDGGILGWTSVPVNDVVNWPPDLDYQLSYQYPAFKLPEGFHPATERGITCGTPIQRRTYYLGRRSGAAPLGATGPGHTAADATYGYEEYWVVTGATADAENINRWVGQLSGSPNDDRDFDGCMFPLSDDDTDGEMGWQDVPVIGEGVTVSTDRPLRYAKVGDRVFLRGFIGVQSASFDPDGLFRLPVGCRPVRTVTRSWIITSDQALFHDAVDAGDSYDYGYKFNLGPDGRCYPGSGTTYDWGSYGFCVDGISFTVGA